MTLERIEIVIEIGIVSPATKYADPIRKITQSRNLKTDRQRE